ncbi:tetratricopeptide repeat protein [Coleofasciculus sp. FACHB-64]|uniref:CHAT domain-containing protein n=1 Tax=Cyanophyceae TaxID=3028117 RepID=UPI001687C19E|nr:MULTISPECIES: CHAT domain-containing protein [unclassified Coleofasciculus]MBD1840127.1 tetratricopeptide repeat protein [Coleofasciculus sp. FACHB-501]MBD2046404.1 tetratricopeptide repeat protein [Coleofasciculus sp. FACHB-64]
MYPHLKSPKDTISLISTIAVTLLICLNSSIDGRSSHPYAPQLASAQAQTTQERKAEALRLNHTGIQQFNTTKFREALQTFEQTLEIFKGIGDRQGEGATLNNIGAVYDNLGRYADALKSYEQALVIFKQISDKAGEWSTLNNIGGVYNKLGQYTDALKSYEQALVIAKQISDKKGEGTALNHIGGVYDNLGRYADALKSCEQALVIFKQIGNQAGQGNALNNIGLVNNKLGQYADALKSYKQALVIFKQIGDKQGQGAVLDNIGQVYDNLGQYAQALKFHEQALVIVQQIGDKAGEWTTLNNIGEVYRKLGQYAQALKFHEQALVIHKQLGNKAGKGTTLHNMGAVYDSLGQYADALKSYEQALVIRQQVADKEGEGTTLNNLGTVYNKLGLYPDAEKALFAAMEVRESLRPRLTDTAKVSVFETQANSYRLLQQSLVAQNKINTALEVAERGRARAFVELLASRQSSKSNDRSRDAITLVSSKPPTIQQIQQIAKEQNSTLVQYSIVYDALKNQGKEEWRQSELYIWVIKPTGEVAFKKVDLKSLKTSLKDLVTNSRDSIGVRGRGGIGVSLVDKVDQKQRLQQLHQLLIQPIAEFLPKDPSDRVIFIPQESLFLVPFAALKDANGKYLIEKHTILTAPAMQVLELTRQQRQKVSGTDVLVVGNPTMPRIIPKTGEPPQQLSSLPGAEAEAKAIAQLLNTKPIIGNAATKAAILPQMSKAKIIHLATHGLLDDFKGLSVPGAIALAPAGTDDGLLTSAEIFDLKLNAELAVLSACDTGRGKITGDGVIGLSRSLISAGVPSVIVSLWSVPDSPTAALMTEFYRQMQQNSDKATALRQAMLTTMKQHPDPKNWAAFTLIGEAQ